MRDEDEEKNGREEVFFRLAFLMRFGLKSLVDVRRQGINEQDICSRYFNGEYAYPFWILTQFPTSFWKTFKTTLDFHRQ